MQWWFKKFCKGDESLEDEERSGQPSEVDHDQLWWSSYSFPRSCRAQLNVTRSTVVRHLKQIGRVKKVDKWVPHELTKNLKHCHFWSVIFSYSMQQRRTISQSDCDVQWKVNFIWQPATSSSVAGPRRSSKALPIELTHKCPDHSFTGYLILLHPHQPHPLPPVCWHSPSIGPSFWLYYTWCYMQYHDLSLLNVFLRHLPCSSSQILHLMHLSEWWLLSVYSFPSEQSTHSGISPSRLQSPFFRLPAHGEKMEQVFKHKCLNNSKGSLQGW